VPDVVSGVRKGQIDSGATIHESANIWDLAHVRESAEIGAETIVGRGAYIGAGVRIGSRCKIQNAAQIFEPAVLEDGVFVGPGAILTNDRTPRAINEDLTLKRATDWEPVGVHIERGASVGAGAICVAPVRVGAWAMIAAGAVVVADVRPFELVAGVPARHIGWVGPAGLRLETVDEVTFRCPRTRQEFRTVPPGNLEPLT